MVFNVNQNMVNSPFQTIKPNPVRVGTQVIQPQNIINSDPRNVVKFENKPNLNLNNQIKIRPNSHVNSINNVNPLNTNQPMIMIQGSRENIRPSSSMPQFGAVVNRFNAVESKSVEKGAMSKLLDVNSNMQIKKSEMAQQ